MAREIPANVKEFLRAVLISSPGGVQQTHIERDYKKMTGEALQWRALGFRDLYEFLLAIPDVGTLEYSEKHGENKMFGKAAKETYQSVHAKKAQNIPDGLRPHRPPLEWSKIKSPDKSKAQNSANSPILYPLHVSNIPLGVCERDLRNVFGKYGSLKVVVIKESLPAGYRYAFVKFTKKEDYLQALSESHVLNGAKLNVSSGTVDSRLLKTKVKYPTTNNFVLEEEGLYSVHVSNFPAKTTKDQLEDMFVRTCGVTPIRIDLKPKFSFVYFKTEEDALTALQNGMKCQLKGKSMTVTSRTKPGQEKRTSPQLSQDSAHSLSASASQNKLGSDGISPRKKSDIPSLMSVSNGVVAGDSIGMTDCQSKTSDPLNVAGNVNCDGKITTEISDISSTLKSTDPVDVKTVIHIMLSGMDLIQLASKCRQSVRTFISIADEFNLLVTEVVDSCTFWAHIDDGIGSFAELESLGIKLQEIQRTQPSIIPEMYVVGAARFTEDNRWYRCWCLDISHENHMIKVFYLDYGNAEWLSWHRFTPLPQHFWKLPPQAVPFRLSGLDPKREITGHPVKQGSKLFSELVCNKVCKARKCAPQSGDKPSHIIDVELTLNETAVNHRMLSTGFVVNKREKSLPNNSFSLPKLVQPPSKQIEIKICWVEQPMDIYYQMVTEQTSQILEVINYLLRIYNIHCPVYPIEGLIAIKWNDDGSKQRVQIMSLYNSGGFGINKVAVRDVDKGIPETVPLRCLSTISPELNRMPFQAYHAKLHMMEREWPSDITPLLLEKMRQSEVLRAKIIRIYPDGTVVLELFDAQGSINVRALNKSRALIKETTRSTSPPSSLSSVESTVSSASDKGGKSGPHVLEDWDQDMAEHAAADVSTVQKTAREHHVLPAPEAATSHDSFVPALPRPSNVEEQSNKLRAVESCDSHVGSVSKHPVASTAHDHGKRKQDVSESRARVTSSALHQLEAPKVSRETNSDDSKDNDRAPTPRAHDLPAVANHREDVKLSKKTNAEAPNSSNSSNSSNSGRKSDGKQVPIRETSKDTGAGSVDPPGAAAVNPTTEEKKKLSVRQADHQETPPRVTEVPDSSGAQNIVVDRLEELEELTRRLEREKKVVEMETRVLRLQKELRDLDSEKAKLQEDFDKH